MGRSEVLDRVWERVLEAAAPPRGEEWTYQGAFARLKAAPPGYSVVFATHYADAEIVNGGVWAYFSGSTSMGACEAHGLFKDTGSDLRKEALLRGMAKLLCEYPDLVRFSIPEEVQELAHKGCSASFDDLSELYYSAGDSVEDLLSTYVAAHLQSQFKW